MFIWKNGSDDIEKSCVSEDSFDWRVRDVFTHSSLTPQFIGSFSYRSLNSKGGTFKKQREE